jgi:hypothetical protein
VSDEKHQKKSRFEDEHFFPLDLAKIKSFLPVEFAHKKLKIEQRKTLEFDPEKIKPGEGVIVRISKWGGLSNVAFAVMNVSGKNFKVQRLV